MSNQKRLVRRPMLYIAQPDFKPAEVPMQTSYQTQRPDKNSSGPSGTSVQENERRLRKQNQNAKEVSTEDAKMELTEIEPENEKKQEEEKKVRPGTSHRERRQRFQDLSLEGKVNYFFNLSPHVPKMKCEVSTEDERYRGYINKFENGVVHMKVFQRPFHQEIPFINIKDIRLVGF